MLGKLKNTIRHIFEPETVKVAGIMAQWKKVGQLKPGMKIAIENNGRVAWDEIVSIKRVGRERVWDIEVEGTHNFVGNSIIAHNTYISDNIGAFAEIVAGKVRAGLVEVADLSAINIIASKLAISEKIISPLVEAEEVRTKTLVASEKIISPVVETEEVSIKYQVLSIKDKEGKTVVEIDEQGDTTILGTLRAQVAEIAERIKTKTLEVEELFVNGQRIESPLADGAAQPQLPPGVADLPRPAPNVVPGSAINIIASKLATSEGGEQLPLVLASDWTVLGTTSLAQTSVAGIFSQDGSLVIDKGSEIDNIVGTLYLQRLGRGGLDILNGKVVLDTKGNLTVDGDIVATGKLEVADLSAINIIASKLATSEKIISPLVETKIISPLAGNADITVRLGAAAAGRRSSEASAEGEETPAGKTLRVENPKPEGLEEAGLGNAAAGKFKIVDSEDKEVASIDSRGVARFAKLAFAEEGTRMERIETDDTDSSGVADSSAIEGIASKLATSNSVSNSSVGTAILPSGDHSVEIETTAVTAESLIFVTPTSPTGGATLYISEKQAGESFTVSLEKEYEERDVEFNWWVIN